MVDLYLYSILEINKFWVLFITIFSYFFEWLTYLSLVVLSYEDLLIDISEIYGIIIFVFILILSSSNISIFLHQYGYTTSTKYFNYNSMRYINYRFILIYLNLNVKF